MDFEFVRIFGTGGVWCGAAKGTEKQTSVISTVSIYWSGLCGSSETGGNRRDFRDSSYPMSDMALRVKS
jgi:hypothetical protein